MALDVGAVFIPVLPNLSGFGPALNKGLSGATSGISAVGAATTAAAVGLGIFAAASVKAAIEFDRSFTRIAAISNTSADSIEGMKDSVMALSGETAVAPTELADALFFLSSAGLDAADVMPALEASAKAAAVGLGTTADVANIVASAMNAYAKEGLTAAEVTDTLVAAVREGRAEPEEFANALGRILPIASAVGVSFDQVAASMAALSNIGLDVNEGVTAMRGVLQAIAAPGSQAAEAMAQLGLSAQDLLDAISEDGIIGALRLLDTAAKEQTDTQAAYNGILRKVVPNVRALTGVLGLTVQQASKVNAIYEAVKDSTGDLGEAFRTTAESDAFQLKQAFNDISIAGQEFARDVLPGLTKTFKTLAPIIEVVGKNLGLLLGVMLAFKVGSIAASLGATTFGAALGPITAMIVGAVIAGQTLNDVFYGMDQTADELAQSLTGKLEPALDAGIISASQYAEAQRAIRDPSLENIEILFRVQKALYDAAKAQEVETASKAAAKVAADSYVDSLNRQHGPAEVAITDLHDIGQASHVAAGGLKKVKEAVKQLEPAFTAAIDPATKFKDSFQIQPNELNDIVRNSAKVQKTYADDLGKLDKMKVGEGLKRQLAALGPEMVHAFVNGNKGQQQKIAAGLKVYEQALDATTQRLVRIMGGGGSEVASAFTQGMVSGLRAGSGSIYSTITSIIDAAIIKAQQAAESHSPSKKMFRLGRDLMKGLENGISDGMDGVISALMDVDKEWTKVWIRAAKTLQARGSQLSKELDKLLTKMHDFRDSIQSAFDIDLVGGLLGLDPESGITPQQYLADQVAAAQAFGQALKGLQAAGVGPELLSQIAAQGVEALPLAQQLLADPELLKQFEEASKAINQVAQNTSGKLVEEAFGPALDRAAERIDRFNERVDAFIKALNAETLGREVDDVVAALRRLSNQLGGGEGGGGAAAGVGGAGGKPNVVVNVNGWVGSDQDIAEKLRRELLRTGHRVGSTGLV